MEYDGTRMIFVGVRRGMDRISNDVELLVAVARRLRAEGRMMGRARLPGGSRGRRSGGRSWAFGLRGFLSGVAWVSGIYLYPF